MSQTHSAKLISITPKAEELIAYCARVSNPKNQENHDTAPRLLRYCITNGHWSPFEMANMVVEVTTTRSIAPQILRHRSFSFQEFSQRYADISSIGYPVIPAFRRQDLRNRQNSVDDLDEELVTNFQTKTQVLFDQSRLLYEELLSVGVAKECAREVLPLATPTRLYMAGNVRSWLHYIELRSGNGTQLEHRQIALQAKQILSEVLPSVSKAMWSDG